MTLNSAYNVTLERGGEQIKIPKGSRITINTYWRFGELYFNKRYFQVAWKDMYKIFAEFFEYRGIDEESPMGLSECENSCDKNWVPLWRKIEDK